MLVTLLFALLGSCKKDKSDAPSSGGQPGGSWGGNGGALTAPQLLAPSNGAGGLWTPITFSWQSVADADAYEARSWYYLNGGGQGTFILSLPYVYTTTYTPNSALAIGQGWEGRTIYWHVRALRGSSGNWEYGPWSSTYSFTLAQ